MNSLTQAERDRNTHEYFKAFAIEQQKRNALRHEAIVAANPWIAQARAIQKSLNESESK
jgi:hypothetical protein